MIDWLTLNKAKVKRERLTCENRENVLLLPSSFISADKEAVRGAEGASEGSGVPPFVWKSV